MPQLLLRIALAAVLMSSAALKARRPRESVAGLESFGFSGGSAAWAAWAGLIVLEVVLAAGVVAGSEAAALAASAALLFFSALLVGAILRGRAGAPCACFGAQSRIGWSGVARNLLLAAAFAVVPLVPNDGVTTDGWLALGLGVSLVACGGLAVAVLGLAREVGMLRLRLGPESALEIPEEGPALGSHVSLGAAFEVGARTELLLAVFLSDGCHVCRTIEPLLPGLAKEPVLSLAVFDEVTESSAWTELGIPGSPYAVALDLDGTVLAKGSFNTLGQLESVLATAERRAAGPQTLAEAIGV
jgi:hypothetical protein